MEGLIKAVLERPSHGDRAMGVRFRIEITRDHPAPFDAKPDPISLSPRSVLVSLGCKKADPGIRFWRGRFVRRFSNCRFGVKIDYEDSCVEAYLMRGLSLFLLELTMYIKWGKKSKFPVGIAMLSRRYLRYPLR